MNARASVLADLNIFGGSVVRDVVAPIKMVGEEIVINIPAAIGLTSSPDTACVLTDASRASATAFHESNVDASIAIRGRHLSRVGDLQIQEARRWAGLGESKLKLRPLDNKPGLEYV